MSWITIIFKPITESFFFGKLQGLWFSGSGSSYILPTPYTVSGAVLTAMMDSELIGQETLEGICKGSIERPIFRGPYYLFDKELAIPPPRDLCISKEEVHERLEAILIEHLLEDAWSNVSMKLLTFEEGFRPVDPSMFALAENQLKQYITGSSKSFKLKKLPLKVEGTLGIKLTEQKIIEREVMYTVKKVWVDLSSNLSWAVDLKLPSWLNAEKVKNLLEGKVVRLGGEGGAVKLEILSKPRLRGFLEESYKTLPVNSRFKLITLSHTPISLNGLPLPAGYNIVKDTLGIKLPDMIEARLIALEVLGGFDFYNTSTRSRVYRKRPVTMLSPGSLYLLKASWHVEPENLLSLYDVGIADYEKRWRLGTPLMATYI